MDRFKIAASSLFLILLLPAASFAGEADVIGASARKIGPGIYWIAAKVRHADSGWDHYADRWEVLIGDEIIAARVLAHPHVDEQPFTRSMGGVEIPSGVTQVTIRAHDKVHGYGGQTFELALPK